MSLKARSGTPNAYRRIEVYSNKPADQIVLVYEALLRHLKRAKLHIENGDLTAKADSFNRANDVVLGLMSALDLERGGQIAERLNSLYLYFSNEIMHINRTLDIERLDKLIGMIEELYGAWKEAAQVAPAQSAAT